MYLYVFTLILLFSISLSQNRTTRARIQTIDPDRIIATGLSDPMRGPSLPISQLLRATEGGPYSFLPNATSMGDTETTPLNATIMVPYCFSLRNTCSSNYSLAIGYRSGYAIHTEGWFNIDPYKERVICWKVSLQVLKPLGLHIYAEDLTSKGVPRSSDLISSDGGTWQASIQAACILTGRTFHFVRYDGPGGVSPEAWRHNPAGKPNFVPGARATYLALGDDSELLPTSATSLACSDLRKGAGMVEFSYIGEILPGIELRFDNSFSITCEMEERQSIIARTPSGCCLSNEPFPRPADPSFNISLATTGPDYICYKSNVADFSYVLEPLSEIDFQWNIRGGAQTLEERINITKNLMPNFNNDARSFMITERCEMELFTEANYLGDSAKFTEEDSAGSLRPFKLDRRISSMKCTCPDPLGRGPPVGGEIRLKPPPKVPCRLDLGACSGLVCEDGNCNSLDPWNADQRLNFDWDLCKSKYDRMYCPIGYIMCNDGSCLPDPGKFSLQKNACDRRGGGLRMKSETCAYCDLDSCYQREVSGKLRQECSCNNLPPQARGPYTPSVVANALKIGACQKCVKYASPAAIFKEPRYGMDDIDKVCMWCKVRGCPLLDPRCAFCDECVL